jgi:hypothetical protein
LLPCQQPAIIDYSQALVYSFRQWTGRNLIAPATPDGLAHILYHAPFVVVAHGTEADPVFCYANLTAQHLWKMPWDVFTMMPSRQSAEPDAQEERKRLLETAARQGYVDDYHGVRITADGRRFRINDCILWNVLNKTHDKIGQAATFSSWEWVS